MCTVLAGRVDPGPYQPAALTEAHRARGQALMCCAVPLEDVEIEVEGIDSLAAGGVAVPRRLTCRVERMEPLSEDVMRLVLALTPGERMDFVAGKYVNVVLEDSTRRAFSFASDTDDGARHIQLHVRLVPGVRITMEVLETVKV